MSSASAGSSLTLALLYNQKTTTKAHRSLAAATKKDEYGH